MSCGNVSHMIHALIIDTRTTRPVNPSLNSHVDYNQKQNSKTLCGDPIHQDSKEIWAWKSVDVLSQWPISYIRLKQADMFCTEHKENKMNEASREVKCPDPATLCESHVWIRYCKSAHFYLRAGLNQFYFHTAPCIHWITMFRVISQTPAHHTVAVSQ